MSKIRLHGSSSGYTEIAPVAASGNNTITLPDSGTIVSHDANGVVGVTSVVTDTIKVGSAVTIGESGVNVVGVVTASSGIVGLTSTGMPAGSVLQVVHVENTAYAAQDSVANTKYDGLSFGVQITPTSSSSTIMLWYSITLSAEVAEREITLTPTVNDGSSVSEFAQGLSSGSKVRINASDIATERNSSSVTINFHCHHSPSTTSQRTYGFYHTVQHDGGWIVRNQSFTSPDNANSTRSTSTITAMEVAG